MSPEPILRLEGVSKYFGEFTALDNINLEIDEGEFLTIVGPSGSGKTTLIRILVGIEELSKGCLLYTSPSPRDRQKSRMPSSA